MDDDREETKDAGVPVDKDGATRFEQEGAPDESSVHELGEAMRLLATELRAQREERRALRERPDDGPAPAVGTDASPLPGQNPPAPKRGFFRAHPWRVLLLALVIAGLVLGALDLWNYLQTYETTDDAQIGGNIDPISSRINGTVTAVYVNNTDVVRKGEPLVRLDPRDYALAVARAKAQLALAEAGLNEQRQDREVAHANLLQAKATNAKAQQDLSRFRALFEDHVVSRETYDKYLMVAQVDASAVASKNADLAAADKAIVKGQAAVAGARVALAQARLDLSYTTIVAPAAGEIGEKTAEVGQRIEPTQQLMAVVPLNDLWVTANFRETQVRRIRPGQRVTIHVDATGKNYRGYVEGVGAASGEKFSLLPPENATGNYVKVVQRLPVRIGFYPGQDPHHRLRVGMSVEPTVWINRK